MRAMAGNRRTADSKNSLNERNQSIIDGIVIIDTRMLNLSAVVILAQMKVFASAHVTNLVWQD